MALHLHNMFRVFCLAGLLTMVNSASLRAVEPHIIGGAPVSIEQYPYQASLRRYTLHICGASILGPKYIVTAAHCLNPRLYPASYEVRVGSSFKSERGTLIELYSFFRHPDYEIGKLDFDAGVAYLVTPIQFGNNVQPIALVPINKEPQPGDMVTASGWGGISVNNSFPRITELLIAVTIPIVSREKCRNPSQMKINSTMICAGSYGKTIFKGDSGGPLINDKKELVGIVSFTNGGKPLEFPGVFANIASPTIHEFITNFFPEANSTKNYGEPIVPPSTKTPQNKSVF